MKIYEFNKYFPDEAACRRRFREWRDKEGVTCQHCGSHDVVWLESKQQYQCVVPHGLQAQDVQEECVRKYTFIIYIAYEQER